MVRSMASDVSTLSGGVANGHQTFHLVSSTPSKIPYGGFSPVRLQTSLRRSHLRLPSRPAYRLPLFRVVGLRCLPRIQAGPRLLTRTAGPVALGSPTGSIVRPDHCLLWPHLRLCRPPAGLWIIPSSCLPVPTEGPQFTLPVLLTMPLPVLRWLQRLHLTMPSPLVLPSPRNQGLGSHNSPTNPDPMGSYYRSCNIRFMLRPGHLLALLRSGLLLPSLLGPGRPSHPSRLSLDPA